MENNYRVRKSFFFTLEDNIIEIPEGALVFRNSVINPSVYCITHRTITSFTVDSSFVSKNSALFESISVEDLDSQLEIDEICHIISHSDHTPKKIIQKLGDIYSFVPLFDEDVEDLYEAFEDSELDHIGVAVPPVTAYTWTSTNKNVYRS
jgi:hypothetical protein